MKILFLGRHYTYFRNFESVVRELAARGHQVHLAVEREDPAGGGGLALVEGLAAASPNVTHGEAPGRADDDWGWSAGRLRLGIDYLRYQHRLFDRALKLRERARERTPHAFVVLGRVVHAAGDWSRRAISALVRRIEHAVPEDPNIRGYLERQKPDLLLLTPLISLGSSQVDYLRAAHALGIPTTLCVWSWDHLSSKALIREWPDRVLVWNETQKREAIELHGLPAHRVVVTGAQCFDQWFDRQPSRTREDFCREIGLPLDRPYLLYVCSALFPGGPIEAPFVVEWVRRVRASGSARLRGAGILIRPHPSRRPEWDAVDTTSLDAVVWGGNPIDARGKADYFDSLYHSAVVVGINTSAFIEAGIIGRPVHTLIAPEMAENQTGTVHFDYLLRAGGGLLNVATAFDEHLRQLDDALAHPTAEVKPFVREFVRPRGLDRAATPVFVEEIEKLESRPAASSAREAAAPVWRWALARIARARHDPRLERWVLSAREYQSLMRRRQFTAQKAIQRAEKRAKTPERRRQLKEREARVLAKYRVSGR